MLNGWEKLTLTLSFVIFHGATLQGNTATLQTEYIQQRLSPNFPVPSSLQVKTKRDMRNMILPKILYYMSIYQ